MDSERKLRRALTKANDRLRAAPPDVGGAAEAVAEAGVAVDELLAEWKPRCNRPLEEWCVALRRQADEDLRTIEALLAQEWSVAAPWSSIAMLFQMVFEKIAKAVLARTDQGAFRACLGKHSSASKLVSILKNHAQYTNLKYEWKTLLPIITGLERAHPALSKVGHLEYPWEDAEAVHLPSNLPLVQQMADPRGSWAPRAQRFARDLLREFDATF